jgi:VRR-NUC domain
LARLVLRPDELLFSIPNGGHRSVMDASDLLSEGLLKGIPDLFLAVPSQNYHGLFIEVKQPDESPRPEQVSIMKSLSNQSYKCVVCYTHLEIRDSILEYLCRK